MEWENIGEESYINICELQLKFDGAQLSKSVETFYISISCFLPPFSYLLPTLGLAINPLPPIVDCGAQLNNLEFICVSPTPRQPLSPSKNISKDSGQYYLASSYLDFGDCKLL
jgi:hypothetical protein